MADSEDIIAAEDVAFAGSAAGPAPTNLGQSLHCIQAAAVAPESEACSSMASCIHGKLLTQQAFVI